jgi:hypothetical protein
VPDRLPRTTVRKSGAPPQWVAASGDGTPRKGKPMNTDMRKLGVVLAGGLLLLAMAGVAAADSPRDNDARNEQITPRDNASRRDNPEDRNDASREDDPAVNSSNVLDPARPDPPAVDAEYSAEVRKCGLLRRVDRPACVEAAKKKFGQM